MTEMTREDLGLPPELSMREMWLRDHSDFYPPTLEEVQAIMQRPNLNRWQQIHAYSP